MKAGEFLRTVLWFIVVAVTLVAQSVAQDTPDFSGRWVLESAPQPAADVPRALLVSMSLVRTNVRGESMKPFFKDITVGRELASGTSSETYQINVVGGTVSGVRNGRRDSPISHQRVAWEEGTLVIETGSYTGPTPETGRWVERREAWSLDPDGRLRVAITNRSSVAASITVTLAYRRD